MTPHSSEAKTRLQARKSELGTWRAVGDALGISGAYCQQVASGKRKPSPRLRRALGIAPPKPSGIRVRMSREEAKAVICAMQRAYGFQSELVWRIHVALSDKP